MKKSLWFVSFLLLASMLFAGGQQDQADLPAYDPDQSYTITIGVFDELYDAYGAIIETGEFKAQFPNVTVELSQGDWDGHHERLVSVIAAGSGANDIEVIDEGFVGQFVVGGGFCNLSAAPFNAEEDAAQLASFAVENARTEDGYLIGLPVDIAPGVLFYRPGLTDATGYDFQELASWEDYIAAGMALNQDSDGDGVNDNWLLSSAEEMALAALNNGIGCWIDEEGNLLEPKERFTSLLDSVKVIADNDVHADYSAWSEPWESGFSEGSFASSIMGSWFAGALKGWMASDQVGEWRVGFIPGGAYINMGGSFLGIPEGTPAENKLLAYEILQYLTTNHEAQMSTLMMIGSFPALTACLDDPRMAEGDDYFGGQPVLEVFTEVARNIPALEANEYDQMARGFWISAIASIIGGEYGVEDAYQSVVDNLRSSMD